jgi:serine/threonine-protein kinase
LNVDERLRLFLSVAHATQVAHQSLVVHRDLKPSNIFVSNAGEVKLLDFGIAKLLEAHPLADETAPELRALTPAYAAPEQLRGEPVTTATDVYVLGVVLYELLTGSRPAGLDGDGAMVLASGDVAPPSACVRRQARTRGSENATAVSAVATARRTTPARLARRLEGDIDRVVLKALQPDPKRRYGSAGMLADDIERLLDGRPVAAQPDSLGYRARRFVGRHRVGVAMTVASFVAIAIFAVVTLLQARAVALERDRARLEASRAARVSELVADLFALAEPGAPHQQDISARELLDRGASRIAEQLAGDPPTQAALFNVVGRLYSNLSLHETAIAVLQRALELERHQEPAGSLRQAETMHWLGELHVKKNDYSGAERLFRDSLSLRRRLGAAPADIAATLEALGRGLGFAGREQEAVGLLEEAVAIRRHEGSPPAELMSALNELALATHRAGDMGRAEALFREAVDVGNAVTEPSPEKVESLLHHARLVQQFDRDAPRAAPLFQEALDMARAIFREDHQVTATIMGEYARTARELARLDEAAALAGGARDMFLRLYGPRHREVMVSTQTLAGVLRSMGKLPEAESLYREGLDTALEVFADGHPMVLASYRLLTAVLDQQGKFAASRLLRDRELASAIDAHGPDDVYVALALAGLGQHGLASTDLALAERSFRGALSVREKLHPPDHWRVHEARAMLGVVRVRAARYAEAEQILLPAYDALRASRGDTAPETTTVRRHLADLYERWQRPQLAARYRPAPR